MAGVPFRCGHRWRGALGLIYCCIAGPLAAQQPPGPPNPPVPPDQSTALPASPRPIDARPGISILVHDSLHHGPLAGSDVVLVGTRHTGTTDSLGRTHLAGVAPGTYQIGVFHPLLDTLGISLVTNDFIFVGDESKAITVAIPSPETLVGRLCDVPTRHKGPSVAIGRLYNADGSTPATGVQVTLQWIEYQVGQEIGFKRRIKNQQATTDANGTFRFCGLPADFAGELSAKQEQLNTATYPITIGAERVSATVLQFPKPGQGGRITGRVVTNRNEPVANAHVEIQGTSIATSTRTNGEFSLEKLPSTVHILVARLIGYEPVTTRIDLTGRDTASVIMTMGARVAQLDPMEIRSRREDRLHMVGFSDRKRRGSGTFITREQIEKRHVTRMTDIINRFSAIRVNSVPGGAVMESGRTPGGCVNVFVDGMIWQSLAPGDLDAMLPVREIGAVEIYSSTTTPTKFAQDPNALRSQGRPGTKYGCATVVIWSRTILLDDQ